MKARVADATAGVLMSPFILVAILSVTWWQALIITAVAVPALLAGAGLAAALARAGYLTVTLRRPPPAKPPREHRP